MTERPILFQAAMVRAILAGTKTQTRRIMKPQADDSTWFENGADGSITWEQDGKPCCGTGVWDVPHYSGKLTRRPYGQPGDRLWVRETWGDCTKGADIMGGMKYDAPWYRADADAYGLLGHDGLGAVYSEEIKWRPSIHMPRWASRITLEITDVRVERLQDISEADAIAEGVHPDPCGRPDDDAAGFFRIGSVQGDSFPIARYAVLWESINGAGSWDANPWVWVVEFRRETT